MSALLIDVGNTRFKWTLATRGAPLPPATAVMHAGDPASAVGTIEAEADAVDAIWVANVTGAGHAKHLGEALAARFGAATKFVATEASMLGLRVAYADPARLGVDRWLGLLAAWSRVQGEVCVAGCGTALTFDAVDVTGLHLGGIIAPGLVTSQQAVLGATRFAAGGPDHAYDDGLGKDTEACVRQGALHACAGLVERLAGRQPTAVRFLTGGDAATLRPHLEGEWTIVPDLVLEGLWELEQTLDASSRS